MSDDLRARFARDGIVILPRFFAKEEATEHVAAFGSLRPSMNAADGPLRRVAETRFVFGRIPPPLGDIYKHPKLVRLARRLLGDDVALYLNRLMIKDESHSKSVTPHQDQVYFHGGEKKVSVFVFLSPCSRATGGMAFVPGSHRFGNLGMRGNIDLAAFGVDSYITPAAEPGDIVITDFLLWHWSWDATQAQERPIIQIAYQPADDGSYYSDGVPQPTLVCGEWRTEVFVPFGKGVVESLTTPTHDESIEARPYTAPENVVAEL